MSDGEDCASAFLSDSCTSGSATAWESEDEREPITEMMEGIFQALDRLERRDLEKRREDQDQNPISV